MFVQMPLMIRRNREDFYFPAWFCGCVGYLLNTEFYASITDSSTDTNCMFLILQALIEFDKLPSTSPKKILNMKFYIRGQYQADIGHFCNFSFKKVINTP